MYNDNIKQNIISNLENKELSIANNTTYLASQGYIVNRSKINKISWILMLISAFNNINIFDEEQQHSLENIANNI